MALLIRLGGSGRGFSRGGNILAARAFQDFFCSIDFIRGIAMDGKENATFLQAAFIPLRLIFWYPHPDQCTRETTDCTSDANPRQAGHDRPSCDERTNPRNRKSTDSGK